MSLGPAPGWPPPGPGVSAISGSHEGEEGDKVFPLQTLSSEGRLARDWVPSRRSWLGHSLPCPASHMEVQKTPRQDPDRASHKEVGDMQEDSSAVVTCVSLSLSYVASLFSL